MDRAEARMRREHMRKRNEISFLSLLAAQEIRLNSLPLRVRDWRPGVVEFSGVNFIPPFQFIVVVAVAVPINT